MEDSFQARVDKVFGSLSSSSSSSASTLSALWSLTDQEIEKRERNRDRDGDTHEASPDRYSVDDGFFTQKSQGQIRITKFADFEELEDNEEPDSDDFNEASNENRKRKKQNFHSIDHEDFDIRSSIGLDCTLDFEEEEDEYDKVAVGREKAGERLYMRDIVDSHGTDDYAYHELPSSFKNVSRDPRANHIAAKLRLKEDADTAGNFNSLKLSDIAKPPAKEAQGDQIDSGVNLKPILKRKEISQDGKSSKRVRFQEEFVRAKDTGEQSSPVEGNTGQEGAHDLAQGESNTTSEAFSSAQNSASMDDSVTMVKASTSYSVPDYVRNPSRYTRYTLDSTNDMDEESNRRACMDFLNMLKKPHAAEHCESLVSSPKSLVFTPKKKANDTLGVRKDDEFGQNLADSTKDKAPVGIAARYAEDSGSEICPMEEDEPDNEVDKSCSTQKPGRRYRTRTSIDCDDHVKA